NRLIGLTEWSGILDLLEIVICSAYFTAQKLMLPSSIPIDLTRLCPVFRIPRRGFAATKSNDLVGFRECHFGSYRVAVELVKSATAGRIEPLDILRSLAKLCRQFISKQRLRPTPFFSDGWHAYRFCLPAGGARFSVISGRVKFAVKSRSTDRGFVIVFG